MAARRCLLLIFFGYHANSQLGPLIRATVGKHGHHESRGKQNLMGATDYEGSPSRVQGVSRKRRKEGDEEVHDVVRVAHCMVGAPRGLVPTNQKRAAATGLARNLRQHTLLGLAPEGSGVNLTLFALLHTNDQARDGARHSVFGQDAVSNVLEQLVGGLPHVKLGTLRFNNVTTCASPVAMRRMPCCRGKSPPKFGARGMLINLWPDECLSMVLDYEREHGVSFDWVTRSRPDLACFEPLPSLAALPQTHVYSTVKEDGQMWDTLFLIPRPLLDWFRWRSFGIAQTASKAHCANSARQKVRHNISLLLYNSFSDCACVRVTVCVCVCFSFIVVICCPHFQSLRKKHLTADIFK
mmetsp:Transcript_64959/g.130629  ORF Transcript_64959/g.130629 Transcript_64959/m.130629 type:complete len:353 (+) Transcript_64959:169-1227(+)